MPNGIEFNGAFNQSIDEDYYRLRRTKKAFNDNHIEYKSKRDKDKNLTPKEYLNTIRPYLNDIINDHKTPKKIRVHSRNEVLITKLSMKNGKFN